MMEDLPRKAPKPSEQPRLWIISPHYYGDIVRRLFLASAIIIIFSTPLFFHLVPLLSIPVFSLVIAVALVFLAGYTTPYKKRVVEFDIIVSTLAIFFFGLSAFFAWRASHFDWHKILLFLLLSGLSSIFIFTLYYSVKSFRGMTS